VDLCRLCALDESHDFCVVPAVQQGAISRPVEITVEAASALSSMLHQTQESNHETGISPLCACRINVAMAVLYLCDMAPNTAAFIRQALHLLIGLHCLCCLHQQVFWRGFVLTALTKVLPVPLCVAFSSVNFAALHLSPYNFLPLMILSASSDCLFLRSGGNLLPSLLLHCLWNVSQVLQISLLQKTHFV
jgi:hypothetical protein